MARAVKQRGAHPGVVRLIGQYKCDACLETKLPPPKPLAVMKAIPEKWQVCESDLCEWSKPSSREERHKLILIVDAGSRMKAGK